MARRSLFGTSPTLTFGHRGLPLGASAGAGVGKAKDTICSSDEDDHHAIARRGGGHLKNQVDALTDTTGGATLQRSGTAPTSDSRSRRSSRVGAARAALRVHLTRREGATRGAPLHTPPTHTCSTPCELRARRGGGSSHPRERRPHLAEPRPAAGLGASCSVALEGHHAQWRVWPPAPRCAHGVLLLRPRAAGPPERRLAAASTPSDTTEAGRCTYGSAAPPGPWAIDRLYECYHAHTRGYRRRARRIVDSYGRTSPALLHGHPLAWAATGRLTPTPRHRSVHGGGSRCSSV